MCAALIHPFSFVRRFVSEILYFQQFHILTQTKPNHLLAWTLPNIVRNFSDCDAIKLFCPFTKQNSCTSTFLSPSLLCVWAKIVSLHIHIISAILHIVYMQHASFTETKNFYCFSKMPSNFAPNSTLDKHERHELGPNAWQKTHILKNTTVENASLVKHFIGQYAQPFCMFFPKKNICYFKSPVGGLVEMRFALANIHNAYARNVLLTACNRTWFGCVWRSS